MAYQKYLGREGGRKGGSFELLRSCIKEDIRVVKGSQNIPRKRLNVEQSLITQHFSVS